MAQKTPPARLQAILAREAPIGVIFRQGPTAWVQMILWDTSTDTFTPGQWIRGRLQVDRSDLSPDGSKLIYYMQQRHRYLQQYTAISRPPYFTALALWSSPNYDARGLFISNTRVWLNQDRTIPLAGKEPVGPSVQFNAPIPFDWGPDPGRD